MTTKEMREKRGQIAADMAKLTEKMPLSAEDLAKFKAMDAEQEGLKTQIETIERAAAVDAETRASHRPPEDPVGGGHDEEVEAKKREKQYNEAYWRYMKQGLKANQHGFRGISPADQKILEQRTTLSGTQTEGTTDTVGGAFYGGTGYFTPVGFVHRIEEALKWYGGMFQVAEIMETATGQQLPFPTDNDTTIMGEQVGESTQVSTQGFTWSQIILGAWKYSTKLVPISFELLQDSAFDLESYCAKKFAIRLGRILNNKFTVGAGTTEPMGLATYVAANAVGVGGSSGISVIGNDNLTTPAPGTQVGYVDLVNLVHSVDVAYRQGAKFMMHDLTIGYLKTLKDLYGRPLWTPGMTAGTPDQIIGFPFVPNNDMATLTETSPLSTRLTVLFGALDKYVIRRVKDLRVLRLDERYADYGVVGFLGFARYDGNLLDAGTKPVRGLLNPAS